MPFPIIYMYGQNQQMTIDLDRGDIQTVENYSLAEPDLLKYQQVCNDVS